MTDHRITDLGYGHLGKASYDNEEDQWTFSVEEPLECQFQQLVSFKQWLANAIQPVPNDKEIRSVILKSQMKWLAKAHPETFPAGISASSLGKLSVSEAYSVAPLGSLLAVGYAVDPEREAGSRNNKKKARIARIVAVASGEAGHILTILRPQVELRGWSKRSGAARLSLLDSESPDTVHWSGTGGRIFQVVSANDEEGSGTWLAVRQASVTTLFRPIFGKPHSLVATRGYSEPSLPSLVNPNPVLSLGFDHTKMIVQADFAFNPFYARQIAVIDTLGFWRILDLERGHNRTGLISKVKRMGHVYDDYLSGPTSEPPALDHADGWYKIVWAGDVNTIIVCNRHYVVVFDVKVNARRLKSAEILVKGSPDWILDIQRSSQIERHFYVLTTSRILWIEVTAAGENESENAGGSKVLLSYRHFRDANDETMKLVCPKSEKVSVVLTSAKTTAINVYYFQKDDSGYPISAKGHFDLVLSQDKNQDVQLQDSYFEPCLFTSGDVLAAMGPETQYIDAGADFFQLLAVTPELGLASTLLAINNILDSKSRKALSITAPPNKINTTRPVGPKFVHEAFIVPDDTIEQPGVNNTVPKENSKFESRYATLIKREVHNDLRFRLNWKTVFQHIFVDIIDEKNVQDLQLNGNAEQVAELTKIEDFLDRISGGIEKAKEQENLPITTLIELSGSSKISGDLEQASLLLQNHLDLLQSENDPDVTFRMLLKNLTACPGVTLPLGLLSNLADFMKVFDQLVDRWMTSLPMNVSSPARLMKFKIIRQVAVELCLSSLGISFQDKAAVSSLPPVEEINAMKIPDVSRDGRTTRDSSPAFFSSQLAPSSMPNTTLPTPSRTASEFSYATSASELKENSAISRLRQYAVSIKARPDLGAPSVLSHWPSAPGADPSGYSWEAAQKANADESGNESEHRNRKEEARRRRRTEKFLRESRARETRLSLSQPLVLLPSNQPEASHQTFSSQIDEDLPMTQPGRGAFGSRTVSKAKKGKKKHKAGF